MFKETTEVRGSFILFSFVLNLRDSHVSSENENIPNTMRREDDVMCYCI